MAREEIADTSFKNLLADFLQYLGTDKSYNQSTLNNYYRRLYRLPSFMLTHGLGSYTPDVGMGYYKAYLAEHDVGVSQQKAVLTAIRRFNVFFTEEEFLIQKKHPIELLPVEYEYAILYLKPDAVNPATKRSPSGINPVSYDSF